MSPLFSVIIPTYNRWPLVSEAVESVLAQSFTDYEVIVVDDGSTDETVAELGVRFGSSVTVISQKNAGVSCARNTGVSHAFGAYIAYLDSDDVWAPDKLSTFAAVINNTAQCPPFLFSDFRRFHIGRRAYWPETNTELFPRLFDHFSQQDADLFTADAESSLRCVVGDYPFFPSTFVVSRSLQDHIRWDPTVRYSEDFNFVARIAQAHPMGYVGRPLTTVRMHDSNKSANWMAKLASHMRTLELLAISCPENAAIKSAIERAKGRRHFGAARAFLAAREYGRASRHCVSALRCPGWYIGATRDLWQRGRRHESTLRPRVLSGG